MSDAYDKARALARRWADWHTWAGQRRAEGDLDAEYDGPWDPHGENHERERLFVGVLEYAREAIAEGLSPDDVAPNLAIELDLGDGGAFDERAARDLLEAAGWLS